VTIENSKEMFSQVQDLDFQNSALNLVDKMADPNKSIPCKGTRLSLFSRFIRNTEKGSPSVKQENEF